MIKLLLKKIYHSLRKIIAYLNYFNAVINPFKKYVNPEFNVDSLPFIDQVNFSIGKLINNLPPTPNLPYNLEEKVEFFRENGYVVLENILPTENLDKIWSEIEYVTENNEKFDILGLAHRFNDQNETPINLIPKDKIKGIGTRFIDFHDSSLTAKNIMAHPNLVPFLQASLSPNITVFQSLIFKYSSQQSIHQDYPWVTTKIPSHLVAAWIPMEDVHIDAGPLFYFPKSHRMPKFDFGRTGIVYKADQSLFSPDDFSKYLLRTCNNLQLKKEVLLIKKGDVLIWHGALAHGGMPINDVRRTRKSFVVHYSTTDGLSQHRRADFPEKNPDKFNGVTIFSNPLLTHLKDYFK